MIPSWVTISENNSDFFRIEKSTDNVTWEYVGEVDAAVNSTETLEYSLQDDSPELGILYYRLTGYDLNGSINYSGIRSISINGENSLFVYSNPAAAGTSIEWHSSTESGMTSVQLVDALGRAVVLREFDTKKGKNIWNFGLTNVSAGNYIMIISSSGREGLVYHQFVVR